MPGRWICVMILGFWLASMGWLVQRDILPAFGIGAMNYQRALETRAIEEPVEWLVYRGDREVGNIFFAIRPEPDGTFQLQSHATLNVELPAIDETRLGVDSLIYVDPLKKLDHFTVTLSLFDPEKTADTNVARGTEVRIVGDITGDVLPVEATLRIDGKEIASRSLNLPVDQDTMVLDLFGQLDRLPDLRVGKTWQTRFINPLRAMVPGGLMLQDSMDYIRNTVVGTEAIDWQGDRWPCYKIEHRYQNAVTHSWARVSDGKVLVQEIVFGGIPFQLVAQKSREIRRPEIKR